MFIENFALKSVWISKEYCFFSYRFTFKGIISHFLPNNETKIVTRTSGMQQGGPLP